MKHLEIISMGLMEIASASSFGILVAWSLLRILRIGNPTRQITIDIDSVSIVAIAATPSYHYLTVSCGDSIV